jgi:ADP-heptose:LPS heptosyltransferase/tetratricopeptide (TPR) repeat protein
MLSDLSIALHSIHATLKRGDLDRASLEAIALYDRTVSLDALQLAVNAGNRALHLGQFSLAAQIFTAIVDRDPHQHEARCHLGIAQLSIGEFAQGWTNYDDRPTRRGFIQDMQRYQPRLPLWDGNLEAGNLGTIANSTNTNLKKFSKKFSKKFNLLVMAEQGFGDAIQFARYVPLLIDRGFNVTLGCRPPLAKLLATLPQFDTDRLLLPDQAPPPLDAFTLLMSLPGVFHTTIDTIPQAVPYLKPGTLSAAGRELLMSCGVGSALRVGIVWSGSATRDRDDERSCGLDAFVPLLNTPNVTFFSLQKDPLPRDRQRLLSLGVIDLDPFLLDFSDTAAFIAALDLVISVDTAVVHLAGALGKPVWVALAAVSDWRWLTDREDSPWYPQTRLFRQSEAGDWRSVVVALRRALVDLIHANEPDLSLIDDMLDTEFDTKPDTNTDTNTDTKPDTNTDTKLDTNIDTKLNTLIVEETPQETLTTPPKNNNPDPLSVAFQNELHATIAAFQNQDFETATRLCDRLLQHSNTPQIAHTLAILRGSIAYHCHDLSLALHWFQRSITLDPHALSGQLNLGNTYRDLGQLQAALTCYVQAAAIAPAGSRSQFDVRWERSLALLQAGHWREGFADYEARLDRKPWPPQIDRANPPLWDGTLRPDLTLILRISQGFGDAIQAVRYVPWLKQQGLRGLRIAIESRPPLTRLLRTLDGVDAIVNVGEPLPYGDPQHTRQAFLMSLPHLCRTTIDTIPDRLPYLRSPGWSNESTRQTVDELLDGSSIAPGDRGQIQIETSGRIVKAKPYKIGVIWSGSATHAQDFRRSIPLREFAALFNITQTHDARPIQFYSLQTEIRDRDRAQFDQLCTAGTLINLGVFARDFGDTAYFLDRLDLTIAVDTSVIHLAGALAKPAWVMLSAAPDWRWLRDRSDTPWYPSLRLVRQNHLGNWHIALDKVRYAIENGTELQTPLRCDDAAITEF